MNKISATLILIFTVVLTWSAINRFNLESQTVRDHLSFIDTRLADFSRNQIIIAAVNKSQGRFLKKMLKIEMFRIEGVTAGAIFASNGDQLIYSSRRTGARPTMFYRPDVLPDGWASVCHQIQNSAMVCLLINTYEVTKTTVLNIVQDVPGKLKFSFSIKKFIVLKWEELLKSFLLFFFIVLTIFSFIYLFRKRDELEAEIQTIKIIEESASYLAHDALSSFDLADRIVNGVEKGKKPEKKLLLAYKKQSEIAKNILFGFLNLGKKQDLAFEKIDLLELVNSSIDLVSADDEQISRFSVRGHGSAVLDQSQIVRVLINLLKNALKYSDQDDQIDIEIIDTKQHVIFHIGRCCANKILILKR